MVVRAVLIGAGRMGRVHAAALDDSNEVDLVGVVDPSPAAAARAAGAAPSFPDLDSAAGTVDADACVIAAPTPLHPAIVAAALERGLHVLCEKPLSLDPAQSDKLAERAETVGKVLQVGFWRRFAPPWTVARRLLADGAIGRPVLIRLSQWDADPPPPEFCDPSVSGGLLIDCGVHEFDLAEWLTGASATSVSAVQLATVDPAVAAVGDIDNSLTTVQLDDGTVALIDLSRNARYADDVRTEVLGGEGALFIDSVPTARLRIADRNGLRLVEGTTVPDPMVAGVGAQLEAFAAACRGEDIDYPNARASAHATRLGVLAVGSLRSGHPVEVIGEP